ncbi:MAG: ChaN family lipoprotein [Sandaracinaceae bacterium]|nr:ChaN family lipoprotein [Sandaracinaceae bacterium]
MALGLEMVPHTYQGELDAFSRGEIDEPALLERIEWDTRWGFDFALYRPLFEHARTESPSSRSNAPRELTRAIAHHGLEGLDEAQRAELPELDLSDAAHRAMVERSLEGHPGMTPERLERFYAAQVLWDETMADRAARYLARDGAPARIVVLAGARHVESGLGIPGRAARRGLSPYVIVLPVRASELDEALRADPPLADYLFVTPG